ncbi:MAG: hypothetical protein V9G23_12530 [Giesbergeria sp.]
MPSHSSKRTCGAATALPQLAHIIDRHQVVLAAMEQQHRALRPGQV